MCNIDYIVFFFCILYVLQLELRMVTKSTTGMFQIKGQVTVYPSEQTAGTKVRPLQNPSSQAANLLALASTFGTEPRFDASLHTLWLEVAVTTWVTMLWDGRWFCMAMLVKWASMQYFQCFQIKLLVFCMNTMIHRTPLWACLLSRWTGVISVFTASSDQNRYKYEIYMYHMQNIYIFCILYILI